jgi:hypothetical protein
MIDLARSAIAQYNALIDDPSVSSDEKASLAKDVFSFDHYLDYGDQPISLTGEPGAYGLHAVGKLLAMFYSGDKSEILAYAKDTRDADGATLKSELGDSMAQEIGQLNQSRSALPSATSNSADASMPAGPGTRSWQDELAYFNSDAFVTANPKDGKWFSVPSDLPSDLQHSPILEQVEYMMNFANGVMASGLHDDEKRDFLARFFSDPGNAGKAATPFIPSGDDDSNGKFLDDENSSVAGRLVAAVMANDPNAIREILTGSPKGGDSNPDVAVTSERAHIAYMKFASAVSTWKQTAGIQRSDQDPAAAAAVDAYANALKSGSSTPIDDPLTNYLRSKGYQV